MPRTLVIGDVHGYLSVLENLVDFVSIKSDDTIVALGDYVDRGPDSAGVIEWLIERYDAGQLVPLRGNHDIMFLDAIDGGDWEGGWKSFGGDTTLQSYRDRGIDPEFDGLPDRHRQFLENECQKVYETDTHFFVHANAHYDMPIDDQPDWLVYWEKWLDPPPHVSGKVMVCGHTAQKNGWPLNAGHAVCIDTWVYGNGGWLTCLDIRTGEFWQANTAGETRSSWLDEIPDS